MTTLTKAGRRSKARRAAIQEIKQAKAHRFQCFLELHNAENALAEADSRLDRAFKKRKAFAPIYKKTI